jgi:hypothetical protein
VKEHFWKRGVTSATAAAALVLWIHGCGGTPQQAPPQVPGQGEEALEAPPDECELAAGAQLMLADLVPLAAAGYGTVSPFLYELAAEGPIRISPSAVVVDAVAAEAAQAELKLINATDAARELLRSNLARSRQECEAAGCPREASYRLREELNAVDPNEPGLEIVRYALDVVPGGAEQSAFLLMMQPADAECPPALKVAFEDNVLSLRSQIRCARRDCHAKADDGHVPYECCSPTVARGTWRNETSDPRRPRHCCMRGRR